MSKTTLSVCNECYALNRLPLTDTGKQPICGKCKKDLAYHSGTTEVTASSLQTLIQKSPLPVVVDFWAPWCGPCRAFAPSFQKSAQAMGDKVVFVKLNTEAEPLAGSAFRIQSIPTLIVFNKGLEKDRLSGALPAEQFQRWLGSQL